MLDRVGFGGKAANSPSCEGAHVIHPPLVGRFGEELQVDRDDFVRPETVVQIGLPPNRIDPLRATASLEGRATEASFGTVNTMHCGRPVLQEFAVHIVTGRCAVR
jgi:hypothetical protein